MNDNYNRYQDYAKGALDGVETSGYPQYGGTAQGTQGPTPNMQSYPSYGDPAANNQSYPSYGNQTPTEPIAAAGYVPPEGTPAPEPDGKKPKKHGKAGIIILIITLIVVLAAAGVLAWYFLFGPGAKKEEQPQKTDSSDVADEQKEEQFKNNLFGDGLAPVLKDGKWGYCDINGEMKIEAKFVEAYGFQNGMALVYDGDFYGFIGTDGEYIISPRVDAFYAFPGEQPYFVDGLIAFSEDGDWGYMNNVGDRVVQPVYEIADVFSDGLAAIAIDGKYGYIDSKGNVVIEPQFNSASKFSDGFAAVCVDGKWGYINKDGEYLVEPEFNYAETFDDGYATVAVDKKYGVINTKGEYVIEPESYKYFKFSDGVAALLIDGEYGYVDGKGDVVIEPQYDNASTFDNGMALVYNDGSYSFIDKSGKSVIESLGYDLVYPYAHCGLIQVKKDDKYGYINTGGDEVVEPTYRHATDFYDDGYAIVLTDDKEYAVINKKGDIVIDGHDGIDQNYQPICADKTCYQFSYGDLFCTAHNKIEVDDVGVTKTTGDYTEVMPGDALPHDYRVVLESDAPDCWVYVTVDIGDNESSKGDLLQYDIADGWHELVGYNNIYYTTAKANATIPVLKNDEIRVNGNIDRQDLMGRQMYISVTVKAARKSAFSNAEDAWLYMINKSAA